MRNIRFASAAFLFVSGSLLLACSNVKSKTTEEEKSPLMSQADMVQRGSYLVNAVGCDDCHSPKTFGKNGPELVPEQRLSGYPADRPVVKPDAANLKQGFVLLGTDLTSSVGPWGTSFAANLTPDEETGIGAWTEQNFLTTMRQGKKSGIANGRELLPPMPWPMYRNFSDEDLKSIFAYLKSLPAVKNRVPQPLPPAQL